MDVVAMLPVVLAEVSDKIPSKMAFCLVGCFFLFIVVLFASRHWFWAMSLEFVVIALGTWGLSYELLRDRFMREAIIDEQGWTYFLIAGTSLLLPVLAGTTYYLFIRRRRIKDN
jgi:hypothetical protein